MFNITYHHNDNTDSVFHTTTAQAACLIAYHYMQSHTNIVQATISNAATGEVIRVYAR